MSGMKLIKGDDIAHLVIEATTLVLRVSEAIQSTSGKPKYYYLVVYPPKLGKA